MKPERYTDEMVGRYTRMGYWGRPATAALWDRHAALVPDREALADSRVRLTWADVKSWTDRVALGLLDLGFQRDDVIVVQLPNVVELPLVLVALQKAGVLALPLMMYFRHSEVGHALEFTGARGIVMVPQFGSFDYAGMARELGPRAARLKHVFSAGDSLPPGWVSLSEMSRCPVTMRNPAHRLQEAMIRAGDVLMLRMTSGTTGFPKVSQLVA